MPIPIAELYFWKVTNAEGKRVTKGQHTQLRQATRDCRRELRQWARAKGDVTIYTGHLLWQAHTDDNGKVIVDEL